MDNNNLSGTENTNMAGSTDGTAQSGYQNNYQSNYQGSYQQPAYQQPSNLEEPVTMGDWIISMLICMIPCLNIVMMFVWAFSKSEKKSKSNFFKASLIIYAISIGLCIVLFVVFAGAMAAALQGY